MLACYVRCDREKDVIDDSVKESFAPAALLPTRLCANRAFSQAAQSRTSPICALQVYDFGENNARASHAKRIPKGLEKLGKRVVFPDLLNRAK